MTARTTPPFRADHVGSLLRPPALPRARDRYARGEVSADELRAAEDDAIRDAVALQESVGLAAGHRRRVPPRVVEHGLPVRAGRDRPRRAATADRVAHPLGETLHADFPAVKVDGPIRLEHTIFGDHFTFLQSAVTTAAAEALDPVPQHAAQPAAQPGRACIGPYTDLDGVLGRRDAAYQAEIRALHDLGCRYLQLDDTSFAMFSDPRSPRGASRRRAATRTGRTWITSRP